MALHSLQRTQSARNSDNDLNEGVQLIFRQLERVLVEENAALESRESVDHSHFIERKNQILRELIVLQRTAPAGAEVPGKLDELKALIARNQAILKTNIDAVKEVADVLKNTALDEEADGTYSLNERHRGMAS